MKMKQIILEQLILENRIDDAERILDKLINKNGVKEPTQLKYFENFKTMQSSENRHDYKYLSWMVKQMVLGKKTTHSSIMSLIRLVIDYHNHLNIIKQKDINSFKSTPELFEVVFNAKAEKKKKEEDKRAKKQIDRIYEDEKWLVIVPKSHTASCKYGAGTQWCTTSDDSQHYDEYTGNGILFYFIDKTSNIERRMYKLAMYIDDADYYLDNGGTFDEESEWEFYDSWDNPHNSLSILPMLPEVIINTINDYLQDGGKIENYRSTRPLISDNYIQWDDWSHLINMDKVESIMESILRDKGYYDGVDVAVELSVDSDYISVEVYQDDEEGGYSLIDDSWDVEDMVDNAIDWDYASEFTYADKPKFIKYLGEVIIKEMKGVLSDYDGL